MAAPPPKRITQLDLATPVSLSDQLPVVQGNRTKRMTVQQMKDATDTSCECTLVSRYTTVGTDANTVKKYLYTYTLPGNIITSDGSWLEVHAAGYFEANGNTKYAAIELRDGGNTILITSIPLAVYNDKYWMFNIKYQRAGETDYVASEYASATTPAATLQTPGVLHGFVEGNSVNWEGGAVQICVAAQNGSASANDVICNSFIIEAHLLDPNS